MLDIIPADGGKILITKDAIIYQYPFLVAVTERKSNTSCKSYLEGIVGFCGVSLLIAQKVRRLKYIIIDYFAMKHGSQSCREAKSIAHSLLN